MASCVSESSSLSCWNSSTVWQVESARSEAGATTPFLLSTSEETQVCGLLRFEHAGVDFLEDVLVEGNLLLEVDDLALDADAIGLQGKSLRLAVIHLLAQALLLLILLGELGAQLVDQVVGLLELREHLLLLLVLL